jgi:hypothetical protein
MSETNRVGAGSSREVARASWRALERELARALAALGDEKERYLVLADRETFRYVQFAVRAGEELHAEAVSSKWLPEEMALGVEEIAAIGELGWAPPTEAHGEPGGTAEGAPNFHRNFLPPVDFEAAARLAVRTLRDAFRTPHPARLEYEAFERGGTPILLPSMRILRRRLPARKAPPPPGVEAVRARVLAAIKDASGEQDLAFGPDGDLLAFFGRALLMVRVVESPPYVAVFSPVVSEVERSDAMLRRLDELNARVRFARLFESGGTIIAAMEVFEAPFVVEHVVHACRVIGELSNDLGERLQTEFGGKTAVGELRAGSALN